jgi:enoyl-CoA hydratase/carnithine racemase
MPFARIDIDGPVCVLTLDRPPVNALSYDVYVELRGHLAAVAADPNIRVLVVEASPALRAFSAGADIKEFERLFDPVTADQFFSIAHEVPERLERLEKITIAAVEGVALGGGAELLLSFDFRIFGSNARIGFPEVTVGQFPGTGGTLRLPWLIGEAAARELLLTGAPVDAQRAFALGLCNRVTDAGAASAAARELAHDLAERPAQAVAAIKRSILANRDHDTAAGIHRDTALSRWVGEGADSVEGYRSFVERRPPAFTHAVPPLRDDGG